MPRTCSTTPVTMAAPLSRYNCRKGNKSAGEMVTTERHEKRAAYGSKFHEALHCRLADRRLSERLAILVLRYGDIFYLCARLSTRSWDKKHWKEGVQGFR